MGSADDRGRKRPVTNGACWRRLRRCHNLSRSHLTELAPKSGRLLSVSSLDCRISPRVSIPACESAFEIRVGKRTLSIGVSSGKSADGSNIESNAFVKSGKSRLSRSELFADNHTNRTDAPTSCETSTFTSSTHMKYSAPAPGRSLGFENASALVIAGPRISIP